MFIHKLSPPGQTAAVEATVVEPVVAAAEPAAADAVDADVVDAGWAACAHTVGALCMSAAASRRPSAVDGGLGGGDGCVGAAVGDNAEDEEVLLRTQPSAG